MRTGRMIKTLFQVGLFSGAMLVISGCESVTSMDQGKVSIDDVPKRPAEKINEEVAGGEIIQIRKRNSLGRDRWQVEYRDAEGKLQSLSVDEAGKEVDWVGAAPVEADELPKRPAETVEEEMGEGGKITSIRKKSFAGKDVWEVDFVTAEGKKKNITVDEAGKIVD